jgi:hypothetical protein
LVIGPDPDKLDNLKGTSTDFREAANPCHTSEIDGDLDVGDGGDEVLDPDELEEHGEGGEEVNPEEELTEVLPIGAEGHQDLGNEDRHRYRVHCTEVGACLLGEEPFVDVHCKDGIYGEHRDEDGEGSRVYDSLQFLP